MKPLAKFELERGVWVTVYPEDDPDWSWLEDERGDMEQVCVVVSVFDKSGIVEGLDSLGGIIIGIDDHKQDIRDAIDANDMVAEAKADLEQKLSKIIRGAK